MGRRDDGDASARWNDDGVTERFQQLYQQTAAGVLAYARRCTRRPEEAEDIAAEVFLVAWRRGRTLPRGEDARRWIYGVTRLVAANVERSQRRRTRLASRLATTVPHPSGHAEAVEVGMTVRAAMKHLTEVDRQLLFLIQWRGCSYAEAGRDTGLSEAAVTSRLHRARRTLADVLTDRDTEARRSPTAQAVKGPAVKDRRPGRT